MKKIKVFIADDSALLRSQLSRILRELSEVEIVGEAEDGSEAIYAIRVLKPDVVVLDIRMPRSNGFEVLDTIRRDAHSPIVMVLSNHASPPYKTQAARSGAHFFFDKTNGIDLVKQKIAEMGNCGIAE